MGGSLDDYEYKILERREDEENEQRRAQLEKRLEVAAVMARAAETPVTFQHDLRKPCACKTCETQHRLDEEAFAKRMAEEAEEIAAVHTRPTLDLTDILQRPYVDDHAGEAKSKPIARLNVEPGYEVLASWLDAALEQAQNGKGKERHAADGQPFDEQPIVAIGELLGSSDFNLGQAIKKLVESKRLPSERRTAERLGAINYIVASIILDDKRGSE